MTLRVVIVDDEPLALSLLVAILEDIKDVEIIASCSNGRDAVQAVITHVPDVLFLDIQMPEMNGFDVIAEIQSDILPVIVFTTAYAEYAVEAFKVQALDYVLKPLKDDDIRKSLIRARSRIKSREPRETKPRLLETLHNISTRVGANAPQNSGSLIIKDSDRIAILAEDEVDWLEAAGDYVCVHIHNKTHIARATLKSIEAGLDRHKFQRIHRSTIVNINKIKELIPTQKGEAYVIMRNGKRLKVSRGHSAKLKSRLLN